MSIFNSLFKKGTVAHKAIIKTTIHEQNLVLYWIGWGKRNATPKAEIIRATRFNDRKVRAAVQALRLRGYAIGSTVSGAGFFRIENRNELNETLHQLKARVNTTNAVIEALERAEW